MRNPLFGRAADRTRRRLRELIVAAGCLVTAIAAGGALPGAAADPFVAGQRGIDRAAMSLTAQAAAIGRAAWAASAIGLEPAARRTAARLTDRFDQRVLDEVTEYDGHGRPTAIQQFDTGGRLLSVVRLGWQAGRGTALTDEGRVVDRARQIALAAGLAMDGPARVRGAAGGSGFVVAWDRVAGGVPVPGDGLRINLWPDGSLHNLSRSERPMAARPPILLDRAAATAAIEARLAAWFAGPSRSQVQLTGVDLAWIAPNDTFQPDRADAPSPTLRLAWVGKASTSGSLAATLRGLEIFVDAGDGSLLGGDVVR
jgi:hypothetical protein